MIRPILSQELQVYSYYGSKMVQGEPMIFKVINGKATMNDWGSTITHLTVATLLSNRRGALLPAFAFDEYRRLLHVAEA